MSVGIPNKTAQMLRDIEVRTFMSVELKTETPTKKWTMQEIQETFELFANAPEPECQAAHEVISYPSMEIAPMPTSCSEHVMWEYHRREPTEKRILTCEAFHTDAMALGFTGKFRRV